jgi:hypothetical protein
VPDDLDQRYEEFARGLARTATRRELLKLGLALAGAAAASSFPGRLLAAHKPGHGANNNSAGAQFCNSVFPPGPQRGQCTSAAAKGEGPFVECEGDPARFCGDQCCGAGEICNPDTQTCEGACLPCPEDCCSEGEVCCITRDPDFGTPISFTCLSCPAGQVPLPDCSGCGTVCGIRVCPEGTTCCKRADSPFGACCFPGNICCSAPEVGGASTCCSPGQVCLFPGFGAVGCGPG